MLRDAKAVHSSNIHQVGDAVLGVYSHMHAVAVAVLICLQLLLHAKPNSLF
jgi:hypothetical protein